MTSCVDSSRSATSPYSPASACGQILAILPLEMLSAFAVTRAVAALAAGLRLALGLEGAGGVDCGELAMLCRQAGIRRFARFGKLLFRSATIIIIVRLCFVHVWLRSWQARVC